MNIKRSLLIILQCIVYVGGSWSFHYAVQLSPLSSCEAFPSPCKEICTHFKQPLPVSLSSKYLETTNVFSVSMC